MSDDFLTDEMPDEVIRYNDNPDGYFDPDEYIVISDYFESIYDPTTSLAVMRRGAEAYPNDTDILMEYARINIISGIYDEAEEILQKMLSDNIIQTPDDEIAIRMMLSRVHIDTRNMEEIQDDIESINSWIEGADETTSINAITEMANTLYMNFLYEEAVQVLKNGIEKYPKNINLMDSLIECLVKCDSDFQEAINVCEKAIDVDSYNVYLWNKLGLLYIYTNNIEEAIKAFDYATSIDENNIEAWKSMGDCYFRLENYKKAASCYKNSLGDECTNISLLIRMGDALNRDGRYSEARYYFGKALDIDDDNSDALFGMGMTFFMEAEDDSIHKKKAITWIKRALLIDDNNSQYWTSLAECYTFSDWWQSIYCYNKALSIEPDQPFLLAKLGQAYTYVQEPKSAIHLLVRARMKYNDKSSPSITIFLASAYYMLANISYTKYYLMQAMKENPGSENLFLTLQPDAEYLVNDVKKLL